MSLEFSFKSLYQHLLKRWHLMVAVGLIGALLAVFLTVFGPDRYAARAVVMVDQQVDLALPPLSPVDDVLYVSRETVRLEDLSYADVLWQNVFDRLASEPFETEVNSIEQLQAYVSAPHYQDGDWYFTAELADPDLATALANTWAELFVDTVQSWVETAQLEISLRTQIETTAAMIAVTVDACGQLDWARAGVLELLQTTLSQPDVTSGEFDQAVSVLAQMAASLPGQSISDFTNLSAQEPEAARLAAQGLLSAIEFKSEACQTRLASLRDQEQALLEELDSAVDDSFGVSPYLRIQLMQPAAQAQKTQANFGTAALVGLVVAIVLWLMASVTGFQDRLRWSGRDRN